VGPALAGEGGILDGDEALVEFGVLVGGEIVGVPGLEFAEDAEAEEAGLVVAGEVNPDGGIVIGFVGELDGIDIIGGKVEGGIELELEGDGAFGGIDVIANAVKEGGGVFGLEAEGAVLESDGGLAEAFDGGGEVFVGGGEVDGLIALGEVGIDAFVKGGVEGEGGFGVGGEGEQEQEGHGWAFRW